MLLGDLAFYAGILGITIYLCLMTIKHTGHTGKINDTIKKYEGAIASLQEQQAHLKSARQDKQPEVDGLLSRVMELREMRDQLQVALIELAADPGPSLKPHVRVLQQVDVLRGPEGSSTAGGVGEGDIIRPEREHRLHRRLDALRDQAQVGGLPVSATLGAECRRTQQ